jgi:DNA-directed RNA polymerase specialized sigma24 family protein
MRGDPVSGTVAPMPDDLNRLYRLARAIGGSRALAEEITHEAFARVLARGAGGDFPLLARTLLELADDARYRDTAEPIVLAGEVYAAVAGLPRDLRDAVALVDVAGMSYEDAGRTLEIPPGGVLSRLLHARAELARTLTAAA